MVKHERQQIKMLNEKKMQNGYYSCEMEGHQCEKSASGEDIRITL